MQTLFVFRQVAGGLAFAHERGIIHRDVKPANIVLTFSQANKPPVVKLVDFGIAKLVTDAQGLTKDGEVFGSPLYISPEQATGLKVDQRSDIYSLGCALYETLTGFPPFRGKTAMETMMMHLDRLAVPIERARPEVNYPPGLSLVVRKCMAKEPDARYENSSQLVQDLQKIEQGKGEEVAVRLRLELDSSSKEGTACGNTFPAATACIPEERLLEMEYEERELQENIDEQEDQNYEEGREEQVSRRKSLSLITSLVVVVLIAGGAAASFVFGGQGRKEVLPNAAESASPKAVELTKIEQQEKLRKKLYDSKQHFRLSKSEYMELGLDEPYKSEFVYYLFPDNGLESIGEVANISGLSGDGIVRYTPASGLVILPNTLQKINLGIKLSQAKAFDFGLFRKFWKNEVVYVALPEAGLKEDELTFDWETQSEGPPTKVLYFLEQLLSYFPSLYQLDTAHAPLDNTCLEKIETFKNLRKLEIADSKFSDFATLRPLALINNYDVLQLPACPNINSFLKKLAKNNKLQVLGLKDFNASADELAIFDKLSGIRTFSCSHSRVSNELLMKLKSLPALSKLALNGSSLEAGALPILLDMKALDTLTLATDVHKCFPDNSFGEFEVAFKRRNGELLRKYKCESLLPPLTESRLGENWLSQ